MSNKIAPSDEKCTQVIEKEYDIFKDSKLRYVGYSNEIGEALRKIVPLKYVAFSYFIEIIYFFSDAFHKGHKAYNDPVSSDNLFRSVLKNSGKSLCWQFFATVVIPPLIINRGVHYSYLFTKRFSSNPKVIKVVPTLIGLSMIPVMPFTIDPMVDKLMEKYLGVFFN